MFVREITFVLGNTMPLDVLSGDPSDKYANIKPETSVKIAFGPRECDPTTTVGQELLNKGFDLAQNAAFESMPEFRKSFKALYE